MVGQFAVDALVDAPVLTDVAMVLASVNPVAACASAPVVLVVAPMSPAVASVALANAPVVAVTGLPLLSRIRPSASRNVPLPKSVILSAAAFCCAA
jgi:hypothetical protein